MAYTCPCCGAVSHNPNDERERYCGRCHQWADPHIGSYVLDGHTPVIERDLTRWALWLAAADRCVARTEHELFVVSTVFLGLDHQFGKGPPMLFESMTFVDGVDGRDCQHYSSWDDAEIGHKAMVRRMLAHARAARTEPTR